MNPLSAHLNAFKHSKWLNISIWSIDVILTGTTTPGQSETWSNSNKGLLYIPQSSTTSGVSV